MGLIFEWDNKKAESNIKKHGISFEEASTAFGDELSLVINDIEHSKHENRFILIGKSIKNNTLVVVHLEVNENIIRIISARKATKSEISTYEEI